MLKEHDIPRFWSMEADLRVRAGGAFGRDASSGVRVMAAWNSIL